MKLITMLQEIMACWACSFCAVDGLIFDVSKLKTFSTNTRLKRKMKQSRCQEEKREMGGGSSGLLRGGTNIMDWVNNGMGDKKR